jgi:periplasmic copper chaperone A
LINRATSFTAPLCFGLIIAFSAMAQAPALVVQDAWARQVPGSDVAAVYLTVRNPGTRSITIASVESPVAGHAMIHETRTEHGQSQMRPHEQLVVPAGQSVKLEPGGLHIMLHGMKQSAVVGQSVPVTLLLSDGGKVSVAARVRPLTAQ